MTIVRRQTDHNLQHIYQELHITLKKPPVALQTSEDTTPLPENVIKSYRYEDAKKESGWVLPSDENYHKRSAGIAHTRSLTFLKPLLGGPFFDLEAVWEEHTKFEFGERDVAKTMATMVDQPYVNHIPTMTYVSIQHYY